MEKACSYTVISGNRDFCARHRAEKTLSKFLVKVRVVVTVAPLWPDHYGVNALSCAVQHQTVHLQLQGVPLFPNRRSQSWAAKAVASADVRIWCSSCVHAG